MTPQRPRCLDALRSRYELGIGVARLVTLSLGQWFAPVAAHDRRHLWLAEQAITTLAAARREGSSNQEG